MSAPTAVVTRTLDDLPYGVCPGDLGKPYRAAVVRQNGHPTPDLVTAVRSSKELTHSLRLWPLIEEGDYSGRVLANCATCNNYGYHYPEGEAPPILCTCLAGITLGKESKIFD